MNADHTTLAASHLASGHGATYTVIGDDRVTIKLAAADCGGAVTVIETTTMPGDGPPRHVHEREDELFYILEGEFVFEVGDEGESITARAGDFLRVPRRVPHRFVNVARTPGKLLIICTPGGFDRFVADFAEVPADQPPDFARIAAIGANHGISFV
ncbi:MAG: cupin domain-containing protein [Phycisphaerales bacterium]